MADTTIYTLAKELGMSPSMVSRAFNPHAKIRDDKRKLVLETAEKYGYSPNKFASRLSMSTIKIGILINSRFPVNTEKMAAGIKAAYNDLKDYKIEYDITMLDGTNTPTDCRQTLKKYENFDGIILTGLSSKKYTDTINALYSKKRNVVQVQAINEEADYLFASKHDEATASRMAAEFLYNCLKKSSSKNIILFTGSSESALHIRAARAFEEACNDFGLNLLGTFDMDDSNRRLEELVTEVFTEHNSNIDGIYNTSGISTALCEYLEKTSADTAFVSFDTHSDIKHYLQKGIISATISQNIEHQMRIAFEMLVKHIISGQKVPKTIYTDVQLVLKSNMHLFN